MADNCGRPAPCPLVSKYQLDYKLIQLIQSPAPFNCPSTDQELNGNLIVN